MLELISLISRPNAYEKIARTVSQKQELWISSSEDSLRSVDLITGLLIRDYRLKLACIGSA